MPPHTGLASRLLVEGCSHLDTNTQKLPHLVEAERTELVVVVAPKRDGGGETDAGRCG